jgi:hypothetical protein
MNPVLRSILFWLLSLAIAAGFMVYQRLTGPTYPISGEVELAGRTVAYTLKRSHELAPDSTGRLGHTVRITAPDSATHGTLYWKRLGVDEPFRAVPMTRRGERLTAPLPAQPPAGKLVYHLTLRRGGAAAEIPGERETVTIRFKGAVPAGVLVPHVLAMVLVMVVSVRAAIAALAGARVKPYAYAAMGLLLLGGFLLGPVVQKYAFGAYWTGWPFGEDLTDNKTLIAGIAWAVALIMLRGPEGERRGRWWTVGAAVVVLAIYTIPHSMGGSTFDYASGEIVSGESRGGQAQDDSSAARPVESP